MSSLHTAAHKALKAHLRQLTLSPAMEIVPPNGGADDIPRPCLEIQYIPLPVAAPTQSRLYAVRGIFQVTIVFLRRSGLDTYIDAADQIAGHFAHGTRLYGTGINLTIDNQPNPASAFFDDEEGRLPVSIPFTGYGEH